MAWLWRTLLGALAALCVLEAALQLLPVSTATQTGYYLDPAILTYPAGHSFTASAGWDMRHAQRHTANNLGFIAAHDFVPGRNAIALIGDSHVEAVALDAAQRPDPVLEAALGGGRPVYAFGSPGTSLLDYAERVRFAATRLDVQDFIVLVVPGDIRQSVCGSGQIASPCLDAATGQARTEVQAPPGALKRALRHSALAQYLFSQLKIALDAGPAAIRRLPLQLIPGHEAASKKAAPPTTRATTAEGGPVVDEVARQFFERIRPHVKGRLLLVIDRPFKPELRRADFDADAERFIALAHAQGADVLDMASAYAGHARQSPLSLAVSPTDQHHNALGVQLLARAIADRFPSVPAWQASAAR
ncbi:MAG: hypothetical protein EOP35_18580 [Rubrivivax sp.]|nr:MAG: hypothetical protein EOP35_18580 [Rubrivivax sp.]